MNTREKRANATHFARPRNASFASGAKIFHQRDPTHRNNAPSIDVERAGDLRGFDYTPPDPGVRRREDVAQAMLIRLGYDIQFNLPARTSILTMLYVHPSRAADLVEPDEMNVVPDVPVTCYVDGFGNRVGRLVAPAGSISLTGSTLIDDSGEPDAVCLDAQEHPVEDLPNDVLQFLLNSRYCEVDRLSPTAVELFGWMPPGWNRVQAICNWVNSKVSFAYRHARPSKTALDVYTERVGVCRDYQHLAITFCRSLNIPARYATGYLGDIGVPLKPPMDFSAWFEVYLSGRWWAFDARNNVPRVGRVLMAVGRDASDVAITTSFGIANLTGFSVVSELEVGEFFPHASLLATGS